MDFCEIIFHPLREISSEDTITEVLQA